MLSFQIWISLKPPSYKETQEKMKLHELFPSFAVKIPSPRENISEITIPEVQQGRYNHNR